MMLNLPVEAEMSGSPEAMLRTMATSFLTEASSNKPFLTLMRLIIGESEQFPKHLSAS